MKALDWILRLTLAGVFLYAGFVKMGPSERFAITVAQFTFVPPVLIGLLAASLGWIEIATGGLLLVSRTKRIGAALAAGLLLLFIAALAWALQQGLIVDCGCFGEDPSPSRGKMLFALGRDVVLLGFTAVVLWARPGPRRLPP